MCLDYCYHVLKRVQLNHYSYSVAGANLFIFHIPDDYTNMHLLQLFGRFGNVISLRISIEASTGRGQGFGFVSYDNPESAKVAIQHLHGFQVSCVQS